jgi:hypothetical protein
MDRGMAKKGPEQVWPFPKAADRGFSVDEEFGFAFRRQVSEFMEFDISPRVLNWIELGRVRRELEALDSWIFLDPTTHFLTPVCAEAVPNDENMSPRIVQLQLFQESDALDGANIFSRVKTENKFRISPGHGGRDSSHSRDFFMRSGLRF